MDPVQLQLVKIKTNLVEILTMYTWSEHYEVKYQEKINEFQEKLIKVDSLLDLFRLV